MAEMRGLGRISPASMFHVARTRLVSVPVVWEVEGERREDVESTRHHAWVDGLNSCQS